MNKFLRKYYVPIDSYRIFFWALMLFLILSVGVGWSLTGVPTDSWYYWIAMSLPTLALCATVVLYSVRHGLDWKSASKLNVKPTWTQILIGAVASVAGIFFMMPIVNVFLEWLTGMGLGIGSGLDVGETATEVIGSALLVCVVAPFCEELLMRGVIARGFSRYGILPAAIFSGGIFAMFHMSPAQTLHQFVFGVVITLFYLRGGSMWIAVIMHAVNNASALVLDAVFSAEVQQVIFVDYGIICSLLGAIVLGLAIWAYFRLVPNKFDRKEELKVDYQRDSESLIEQGQIDYVDKSNLIHARLRDYVMLAVGVCLCLAMWLVTLLAL